MLTRILDVVDVRNKLNENLNEESNDYRGHLHDIKSGDNVGSKASSHCHIIDNKVLEQQVNYKQVLQVKKYL